MYVGENHQNFCVITCIIIMYIYHIYPYIPWYFMIFLEHDSTSIILMSWVFPSWNSSPSCCQDGQVSWDEMFGGGAGSWSGWNSEWQEMIPFALQLSRPKDCLNSQIIPELIPLRTFHTCLNFHDVWSHTCEFQTTFVKHVLGRDWPTNPGYCKWSVDAALAFWALTRLTRSLAFLDPRSFWKHGTDQVQLFEDDKSVRYESSWSEDRSSHWTPIILYHIVIFR